MADTSNEPFVKLTLPALVERDPLPQSIAVRVCVHEELHTAVAAAGEGDMDLTLRYDPFAAPLGPGARWQRFGPLPISPPVLREGAEPRPLLVDPDRRPVRPVHPAPSVESQDFWFAPREAQEIDARSMLATEKAALAIVFDTSLELTEIPVLGGRLPPEMGIGLRGFALVWTPAGVALRPELWIRNQPFRLPLVMLPSRDTFGDGGAGGASPSPGAIRPVFWVNVRKALGPFDLHRLGLGFHDEKLWLLMDASLQLGPVKLTALGLGMGIHLGELLSGELTLPSLHIEGLGVEVRTASGVTVGGALLRRPTSMVIGGRTVEYDSYAGAVIIQTSSLAISALGSFQAPPGRDPSLFAYGTLNKPLGGPPFFFVTSLSAGFGVNMRFELPEVDRAGEFPLVREVVSPNLPRSPSLSDLIRVADDLQGYQRSAPGTAVLAMGITGTSFGVINTSLVLLATIGSSLQVDLIGQSVMQLPAEAGVQRLADIRVNWRGKWSPDADKISILGQVRRGSWAFHSAFQLTGQMAFEAWTQGPNAGDFVFTVGGYAPSFRRPQHYPAADRLSMGWSESVGDLTLSVKAEGYCAITPSALMVGGDIEYSVSCGDFDAWYKLEAHFLLEWYPFRYSASLSLEVGASYTLDVDIPFIGTISQTFKVEVGADVKIWGPDLGGKVTFELVFVDVEFEFGASDRESPALTWAGFKSSFLAKDPLAMRATAGLRGQIERNARTVWVITPDELLIELESAIPARTLTAGGQSMSGASFGVRPMKVDDVKSSDIVVKVTDSHGTNVPCVVRGMRRGMPAAQWGSGSMSPQDCLVADLLAGASLSGFGEPFTPSSLSIQVEEQTVNWDTHPRGPGDWQADLGASAAPAGDYAAIWSDASVAPRRAALLREMLDLAEGEPDPKSELRSFWVSELQETPTLKTKLVA